MKTALTLPSVASLPTLQPEVLAERAALAVRELLAEAAAANTTRSYATALRYWAAWFEGRYGTPLTLPVPEAAVAAMTAGAPASTNALEVRVGATNVDFVINGQVVNSTPRSAMRLKRICASARPVRSCWGICGGCRW